MEALKNKRGPYRKYLRDSSCPIPKTSRWRLGKGEPNTSINYQPSVQQLSSGAASFSDQGFTLSPDTTLDPANLHSNNGSLQNDSQMELSYQEDLLSDSQVASDASEVNSDVEPQQSLDSSNGGDSNSGEDDVNSGETNSDDSNKGDSDEEDSNKGDSDEDNFDEEDNLQLDPMMFEPIYDNASITLCGAICAIMEFKRSCGLSFSCINKLLELLQLFCPASNSLPRSVYSIRKFLKKFSSSCKKRCFCSDCEEELSGTQQKCNKVTCKNLQPNILISFNPIKAIKRILKRNQATLIGTNEATDMLCDLHTQGCSEHPGIIFNTDGISPFKSSRLTIWPIIIAFSNLPPNIRMNKDSVVVVSLWVGSSKPKMDVLFQPLIDLLRKLSNQGIIIETPFGESKFKFSPLIGIFDLVAKAPILNMTQFNGVNGCPTCLHPGTWISSRYYLPGCEYPLRTNESVTKAAEAAEKRKERVDGVKGKSVLTKVVDLVKCIPIDYMHCVLEGVTKWLVNKWFTSSNHGSPFYIGRCIKIVDSHLLDQCPPHDFTRAPRSLDKHKNHWKASEFRYWLLYYSLPILVKVLPPLYVHHYSLLVCAMHILLQSKLKDAQIRAAEQMLMDYYTLLPELYGDTSCTLNAHCLTHLTTYVRLWGPLWTHSLFGFESYNGHLTSMIHSKYKVAEQLSFSIDVSQTLGCLADRLIEVENEQTLNFLVPLSSLVTPRKNMALILPGIYSIGDLLPANFTRVEVSAIRKATKQVITNILTFKKLYFHDTILYSCQQEKRKRSSSHCCYVLDGVKSYGVIQKFCFSPPIALIKPYQKTSSSLLKTAGNPGRDRLKQYAELDLLSSFFVEVGSLLPVHAVPISTLLCKCVHVSCANSPCSYVVHVPNNFEHH